MTTARPALDVLRAGPVAAGATLWRSRGQLHVTLVAKATFAMVPGGEARRIEPLEIVRSEVYTRGNPMKPLLAASELAPWLGRAEVVLTGHAWAPGGAPVRRMAVRLALLRAGAALVDKSLEVVGDRAGGAAAGALPEPFVKMPIEYQRAYGGPGEPENPLGVGAGADERAGGSALPNLLPLGGGRAPVGLGPIPPIVPSRTRLLRGLARAELEGIASIPDDFDWSYFQSAPADQRFDRVLGGEEIVLEGLSQHHPTLATRLPALRALATILLPNGAARWLPLVGDTLIVQPDAERCAVVFRGSFQVASEEVLPALRAAVGVEVGDEPVPWPDLSEAPAGAPSAAGAAAGESAKRTDWSSTVRLGEDDVVDAPVSVAGGAARREPVRDGAHPLEGTFPLDDTLPPAGSERRPREARTVPLPPVRVRGPGQDDAVSAPFPIAPAGARGEREGGERPSAPWAAGGAAAVPAIASPLEGTIELSEPEAAPAPAQTAPSLAQDIAPAPTPMEIATPAPAPTQAAAPAPAPTQAAAPAPAPTQAAAPAPAPTQAAAPAPVAAPARAAEPLPAPARDPEVERSPEPRAPAPAPSEPKRERPNLLGSLYKRFRKD
ncbi:DUF2169 family type VI secretion system accessory protein [Sorangium sp. So ce381]|uniref:DUF2169 family type VI secretion system accessory protein n=1 Tax=Sorangium sp. So ce381 TaxID=3133307 RepID=UPI003F5BF683